MNVAIPESLYRQLKIQAETTRHTLTVLVQDAILHHLAKLKAEETKVTA